MGTALPPLPTHPEEGLGPPFLRSCHRGTSQSLRATASLSHRSSGRMLLPFGGLYRLPGLTCSAKRSSPGSLGPGLSRPPCHARQTGPPQVRPAVPWEPALCCGPRPGAGFLVALGSPVCGCPPDGERVAVAGDPVAELTDGCGEALSWAHTVRADAVHCRCRVREDGLRATTRL